jgi:hypothetical protein
VLKTRRKKFIALFIGPLVTLAIAAAAVAASVATPEDHWNTGVANKAWAVALTLGSKATFASSVLTITCTSSTASGSTVGPAPDSGPQVMNPPTFTNCTDTGAVTAPVTVSTNSTNGSWTLTTVSDVGNTKCPAGTGKDETTGKDCQLITVPKGGATVTFGKPLNCTLTVSPSGTTTVPLTVKDPGGTTPTSFTINKAKVPFAGCGLPPSTGLQSGSYTMSAPNNGVVFDNS